MASDGTFWISKALATITTLNKDVKHVTLLEELEEDDLSIRTKAQELVQTLQAVSGDQQEIARGAELLLMAMVIQQYSSDEENSSTESLEVISSAVSAQSITEHLLGLCRSCQSHVYSCAQEE